MKEIRLWSVDLNDADACANPVEPIRDTKTEQRLEDLLVASPEVLMEGVTLIARQLQTAGGPLDLLGVDQDGRVAVFELKRGTLTREAVAQVVDYASDLAEMDASKFARLIEESSGLHGIEKITDFADWYGQEYPSSDGWLDDPPTMVLVGLGVDRRALRMVNFLAQTGVDIRLLTFHAFERDGVTFLARQTESEQPKRQGSAGGGTSKEANQAILDARAAESGAKELLEEIRDFIAARVPAYIWPGKTAYTFSLAERTAQDRPTMRTYVTLYVDQTQRGRVWLVFHPRAVEGIESSATLFASTAPGATQPTSTWNALEIRFSRDEWPEISARLSDLLADIVSAWQARSTE